MHNPKSKKLPIHGRNHSYRIVELVDIEHHRNNAKDHYESVKRKQLIVDYNIAVDNLNDLYDTVMNAQETETDLKEELKTVQNTLKSLKEQIQKAHDKMLVSKARLQHVGISTKDLNKLKPVSQGIQAIQSEVKPTETIPDDDEQDDIVEIPDEETDIAVKNLLKSSGMKVPEVAKIQGNVVPPLLIQKNRQVQKPFTIVKNTASAEGFQIIDLDGPEMQQSEVVLSQNFGDTRMPFHLLMPQNIGNFMAMTQNVPGMSQNIVNFTATPHNIARMSQNVVMATQNIVGTGQNAINTTPSISTEFIIPDGFKNTKYPDTLEKIDLSSSDLNKHLEGCGTTKEKKFKCTYPDCTESYIRSDNLRQHVARVHTKIPLYTCKKCNKGFFTSRDASIHRKDCFPGKPEAAHTEEESEVK